MDPWLLSCVKQPPVSIGGLAPPPSLGTDFSATTATRGRKDLPDRPLNSAGTVLLCLPKSSTQPAPTCPAPAQPREPIPDPSSVPFPVPARLCSCLYGSSSGRLCLAHLFSPICFLKGLPSRAWCSVTLLQPWPTAGLRLSLANLVARKQAGCPRMGS